MGLIVNKPQTKVKFCDLLDQLKIARSPVARDISIHFGGPVEHARGFVLHSSDYKSSGTLRVDDNIGLTATRDVLEGLAKGAGPKISLLALGYSGWGPGQLEAEIKRNGWLTCEPKSEIVFGDANEEKWTKAMNVLGIDPITLSGTAGHA